MSKTRLLAVCHDCQHRHAIGGDDLLHTNAIRDWEVKHKGHRIEFLDPTAYERSIAKHAVGDYRHNADIKIAYGSTAAYTIALASLATDSNKLTGLESDGISNATNKYLDNIIGGKITTGTSPTDAKSIEVIAIGAVNDTPLYPDVFDGTTSAETITSANIKNAISRFVAYLATNNTSDRTFWFGPVSLAGIFGLMPIAHVLFVTHDTAVNLNSTPANHAIYNTPVYATATG